MNKLPKKAIWGILLIAAGTILFLTGRLMGGSAGIYIDSEGIHTAEGIVKTKDGILRQSTKTTVSYQKDTFTPETFDSLKIRADDADISIAYGDVFSVEYCLPGLSTIDTHVTDGILHFTSVDQDRASEGGKVYFMWLDPIVRDGGNLDRKYYVNIKVPEGTVFKNVNLMTTDGDCSIDNLHTEQDCSLHTDWGDIHTKDLYAKNLYVSLGNGSLELKGNADVQGQCSIQTDWGDMQIDNLSSPETSLLTGNGTLTIPGGLTASKSCNISADWGDASIGSLISPETSIAMGNGNLTISDSLTASKSCSVTADWGDIKIARLTAPETNISLSNGNLNIDESLEASKSCLLHADWGDIKINGMLCPDAFVSMDNGSLDLSVQKGTSLEMTNDYGDVNLAIEGSLEDYDYSFTTQYGEIRLPGQDSISGAAINTRSRTEHSRTGGDLKIQCDSGDIEVTER